MPDGAQMATDPALIAAWLTARSLSRGLPAPRPDRGGLRVDTGTAAEACRWVFTAITDGLVELARDVDLPRHLIKLCGSPDALLAAVPPRWVLQYPSRVMVGGTWPDDRPALSDGYRLDAERTGPLVHARILAPDGTVAASGHAAEAAGVFAYDRIETAAAHRRRGLGRAIMIAIHDARSSPASTEILAATDDGQGLYATLGWRVLSPYPGVMVPAAG